jgi:hypothetical protein
MVEVEILGCVMTAQYGTLSTGDILRTSEEFAAHLVNDCAAAKYTQAKEATPAEPEAEPEQKPRKHK